MLSLHIPTGPLTILCLGAHADDIEIGCGGSLLQILDEHPQSTVWWVVLSAAGERADEARKGAATFTAGAGNRHVAVHQFRDGYFPGNFTEIKDVFEALKPNVGAADLIFTHFRHDLHQDHRLVSELTGQTFRDHLILEYEIPKYDGDLGSPNAFIPLSEKSRRRKIDGLLRSFPSQRERSWFTEETFLSLMRLRGLECAAPEGYAEAFYMRKAVIR